MHLLTSAQLDNGGFDYPYCHWRRGISLSYFVRASNVYLNKHERSEG